MIYDENPRSIKYHVKKYLIKNKSRFSKKPIIDFPAGNGVTTQNLLSIGSKPLPFDLFPEYFNVEGLKCERANISEGLPVNYACSDFLICQEELSIFLINLPHLKNSTEY